MAIRLRMLLGLIPLAAGIIACATEADDEESVGGDESAVTLDEKALSSKELLGKRLFEDTNLSEPRGQSCASCHDPAKGFTGNAGSRIPAIAAGAVKGVFGGRNAPTAMYLTEEPGFSFQKEDAEPGEPAEYTPTGGLFWDGRAENLAAQAKGPFLNPREMNNKDANAVVRKVESGKYAALAVRVYGTSIFRNSDKAYNAFADAIAAFERTKRFAPFASKFDEVLRGKESFTAAEARGFELFKNPEKGNCVGCHAGDVKSKNPKDWLFTDFTYDNLGVPRNNQIPDNHDTKHFDLGLCEREGFEKLVPAGVDPEDFCGAFKVPTLRNIEKTAPYMHNGYFKNLRDVVKFYVTRDTDPSLWYPHLERGTYDKFNDVPEKYKKNVNTEEIPLDRKRGEKPRLNEREIDDVVAFLGTLTDR